MYSVLVESTKPNLLSAPEPEKELRRASNPFRGDNV